MSITVENTLKGSVDESVFAQNVHYVPCKIEADGPANVQKYFEGYVTKSEDGDLTASFRGFPLNGTKMTLPEGYRAIVMSETRKPLSEEADRKFQITGGFKEMTYWNWDLKTSKNDNFAKAMDWIDVSEAITLHKELGAKSNNFYTRVWRIIE